MLPVGLGHLIIHERVGAVISRLRAAIGLISVSRCVVDIAGAKPDLARSGAGCALLARLIDQDEFVSMRNEAEAGVIARYFRRSTVGIETALRGAFDVGIFRPANLDVERRRCHREEGNTCLIGQYGVNALRPRRR